ncbi:MAG: hypothetical protein V8Q88_01425 [Christensenellales bacterium]
MLDILDIHTHTIASGHAYNTIYEMAQYASRKGLALLGIFRPRSGDGGVCQQALFPFRPLYSA